MEELTKRKQMVLDTIDEQIHDLEEKLKKVQPLMDELNVLRQTRRVLLSERATTGGGGRKDVQLTMEMMVHHLQANGPLTPATIAEELGVPATSVRAHLSRHKDIRYVRRDDGRWALIEGEDDDE